MGRVTAVGEFEHAVALLLGQAVATGRALHLLCIAGHANQAYPTARAMVGLPDVASDGGVTEVQLPE